MYKGPLWGFSEVREELASGMVTVFSVDTLRQDQLEAVRAQYAYEDRTAMPDLLARPDCKLDYWDPDGRTRVPAVSISSNSRSVSD